MAISNSINYELTAAEIIEYSFGLCGIKNAEQPLSSSDMQSGLQALNLLLKSWSALDIHIWMQREAVLFLEYQKPKYLLASDGDRCCARDDFISSSLSLAANTGANTITVVSTSGMIANDKIGIKVSTTERWWTTIASVDSSTQLTLSDALEDDISSGSSVFTYTSNINRPMKVMDSRRNWYGQNSEIRVQTWARQQYFDQTDKLSTGTVNAYYYVPNLNQGAYYVWQTASDVDQYMTFTYYQQIADVDQQSNTIEFPQEWQECLCYNLALRLGILYQIDADIMGMITPAAQGLLEEMKAWDRGQGMIYMQPNYRGNYQ